MSESPPGAMEQPSSSSTSPRGLDNSPPNSPTSSNSNNVLNNRGGTKEGFLEKKGAVNKNWRERWFVLSNGQLEYFVDKDKQKKKGAILLSEVTEIGPLTHDTRSFCFGLNTGKRLWVLSADSSEIRESWMSALKSYQPRSMEVGAKVPHTTIGSFKKSIMKKINKGDEEKSGTTNGSPNTSTNTSTTNQYNGSNNSASSSTTNTSTMTQAAPGSMTVPLSSSNNNLSGSSANINNNNSGLSNPSSPTLQRSEVGGVSSASSSSSPSMSSHSQHANSGTISPPLSPGGSTLLDPSRNSGMMTSHGSPGVVPRTTLIVSNEPRATMVTPNTFANWNPKLAWTPTPERPAWCYEMAPGLAPELSAWLSSMLSAATRFNMGWAFVLDWVKRIGNVTYTNTTILDHIKQGMTKLQPCWTEFERAVKLAEAWDATHPAVRDLHDQITELRTLTDTKVSGWHVQLSSKKALSETEFEFTYKRQDSGTPERPAWFFQPADASAQVTEAFLILERAATVFNNGYSQAYELSKTIATTNKSGASSLRDVIIRTLSTLDPCFKDFDLALAAFEAWNPISLYTLEVKQQIGSLKRIYETNKKEWLTHLESRASFVPVNKSDYHFEHPAPTPERPAWCFKFSLNTPSDISRGLVSLSIAANIFNSNWTTAYDWANKIGRNMATRAAIKEGMLEALAKVEASWPEFENAVKLLEQWESAATEVIRQVSQLKGLIEESKVNWMNKLATDSEISLPEVGSDFRLSGFGPESTEFSIESSPGSFHEKASPSMGSSLPPTDARLMYENALAASREAASITDQPEVKLNFVPGLGPGSFGNADIYRAVLKELYKAQLLPNTPSDLLADIRSLVVDTQQRHRELCFKWALHYAREGHMSRSITYYEALFEVLPDAVTELDLELAQLKAEFEASPENYTQSMSLASL